MTPLQKIREGVLTNNMVLVAEGYNALSKDKVEPPVQQQYSPQRLQSRQRIEGLVLPNSYDDFSSHANEYDGSEQPKQACRAEPFQVKRRINMFADDKTERLIDYTEADRKDDIKTREAPKAPRPKPYTPVRVKCYSCGRMYNVNPSFVVGGSYRCDNCNSR